MSETDQAIIDAAFEVAVFSKLHTYPAEGTPEFFEFAERLDRLAALLAARYPKFNENIRTTRLFKHLSVKP